MSGFFVCLFACLTLKYQLLHSAETPKFAIKFGGTVLNNVVYSPDKLSVREKIVMYVAHMG